MTARFSTARPPRAFTLIELLLVIGIIALLISILLPAIANARKTARTSVCLSNMRQLALAQVNYANQYRDLISTFNRRPPGFPNGGSWLSEAGIQAQDIVRRLTGQTLPLVPNRYFHRNYWHLPAVADGAFGTESGSLFSAVVACPEDTVVLNWKKNFNNAPALLTGMGSDGAPGYERYRPFWSSYQQIAAAWTPDWSLRSGRETIGQIVTSHHLYTNGLLPTTYSVGERRMEQVALPSNKVWFYDLYDRHFWNRRNRGNMIWHGYAQARQPLVFFDGSVRVHATGDARDGLVSPENLFPSLNAAHKGWIDRPETAPQNLKEYNYTPASGWQFYDPPTLSGAGTDRVQGKYRWTAGGLRGFDYSGKKAQSGN
jgi:prepilin-type N-terminal cleavage/methylation domain-containing protein